jgi:glycerophosphoryl diester phosphodiesterase
LGNPLRKVSDDGYATPAPDLILEQGVVPDKYEVPLPVIGHRGASADVPENCLGALEYCKGKGCDFAFLDVSITKDNVGVLFHDESLARIAGISKKLKDLTWDQVQDVDVSELHHHRDKFRGQSVPSLELAVDTCIELNIKFFINVVDSSDEMIDAVCRAYKLNKAMYSMAAVTSFHWKVIYGIRKRDPKIIGCLAFPLSHESKQKLDPSARTYSLQSSGISAMEWLNETYANFLDWFVEAFLWWYLGLTAVFIHKDCISKTEIRDWGSKGIRVFLWMVDTKEEKQYINKILKVGYLTRTLANDPILTSRKKNKESAADSNRRKLSKSFAGSKNSAESVSSEDSMHSIPPSPEMSLHSEYIQQMLARAAAQLR